MNLDTLRDLVIDVLAGKISKKYQDDFKSLIIGEKYNIKYHVCMVFVFKSDPKLLEKYKETQAEMDKKEKEQKGEDKGDDEEDEILDCIFNFISRIDFKKLKNLKLSDIKDIGGDALKGAAKELGLPTSLDDLTKIDLNTVLKNEMLKKILTEKLAEMGITLPEGINFDDLSSLDINKAMQNDKLKGILKDKIEELKIVIPQGKNIEDALNSDKEMKKNVLKEVIKDMVKQMLQDKIAGKLGIPLSLEDLKNINLNTVLKNEMFKKILTEKLAEMGITLPDGINFDDLSSLDINKAMQNDKLKGILKEKIDELKVAIPQGKSIEDVLNSDKEMKNNVLKEMFKDMVKQMIEDKMTGKLGISIPKSFDDIKNLTDINLNTVLKNETIKRKLQDKLDEMGIVIPEGFNFDDLTKIELKKAMKSDKMKDILKEKIEELKIDIPNGKNIEDVLNSDKEMKNKVLIEVFKDVTKQIMMDQVGGFTEEKNSEKEKSKNLNYIDASNSRQGGEKDELKREKIGNEEGKKLEGKNQKDSGNNNQYEKVNGNSEEGNGDGDGNLSEVTEKELEKNDYQGIKKNDKNRENLREAKNLEPKQIQGDIDQKDLPNDEIKLKQNKSLNVDGGPEKRIENSEVKEAEGNSKKEIPNEKEENFNDPKSGIDNILDEKKQQLLAAVEEEKKKLLDIAEEQKKKVMEEVEAQKQEALKKLNEMNPMNNIKAKMEEEGKKMQAELAKINPMASIGDPKKLLEPGGLANAASAIQKDIGKAIDIGKNTVGNLKDGAGKTPEQGDAKLDIGAKAEEVQKKGKEQLEKGKAQIKAAVGEAAKNLKNKIKELTNIKNLKKMLTINNLLEWGKKLFGMVEEKKDLSERQKVIANLKFLSNIFAEIVC
jgi:hypothetical protein